MINMCAHDQSVPFCMDSNNGFGQMMMALLNCSHLAAPCSVCRAGADF